MDASLSCTLLVCAAGAGAPRPRFRVFVVTEGYSTVVETSITAPAAVECPGDWRAQSECVYTHDRISGTGMGKPNSRRAKGRPNSTEPGVGRDAIITATRALLTDH